MNIFESIRSRIAQYLDTYLDLLKVDFMDRTSKILSFFVFGLIGLFILTCFVFMLNLGLVELLAENGIGRAAAYFVVGGLNIVFLLLFLLLRSPIIRSLRNIFIGLFSDDDDDR